MKLTTGFKEKIAGTFYDKEVDLLSSVPVIESDGWTGKDDLVKTGSFFGNVRFSNLAKIQEDYGIKDEVNIAITTNAIVPLEQLIMFRGLIYKVNNVPQSDSHYLITAQKWSSKLSILISA